MFGKLIQPAGIAKTLLSETCLKVRELFLSGARKRRDASSERRESEF
jgi:hypothetical protein